MGKKNGVQPQDQLDPSMQFNMNNSPILKKKDENESPWKDSYQERETSRYGPQEE